MPAPQSITSSHNYATSTHLTNTKIIQHQRIQQLLLQENHSASLEMCRANNEFTEYKECGCTVKTKSQLFHCGLAMHKNGHCSPDMSETTYAYSIRILQGKCDFCVMAGTLEDF